MSSPSAASRPASTDQDALVIEAPCGSGRGAGRETGSGPATRLADDFYAQTPDANALATEAVMNTIRTADMLFDRIGRLLRPLGVSAAGGLVVGLLRDSGPLSPSEIGERLIVTRATVTGVVDSLESRGHVRRTPNPSDRRSILVELTPEGLAVVAEVRTLVHRNEKEWMSRFSDDELRAYVGLHHRIQDVLTEE